MFKHSMIIQFYSRSFSVRFLKNVLIKPRYYKQTLLSPISSQL